MKHATKYALAFALVTGVSATALSVDTASARGWGDGWNQGQNQNWQGKGGEMRGQKHMGMRRGGKGMGGMAMLQQFDTNKDNAISKEELVAGLEKKITDNDTDGDGAVSLEEFKAEWMKMTQQRMVRAYQRMDRDGNGKVTADELKEPALFMFDRRDFNNDGKIDREDRPQRQGKWGGRFMQQQPAPSADTDKDDNS